MLFRGFSAYPGLFYPRYFSRSTKPAPPSLGLAAETGQHRLSPALCCVLPHPLQNRVPRVQVLLPLPKTGGNTAFLPVFFLHVLHGFVVHFGSDTGFSHPASSVSNRCHPLQHPKRTRLRLFSPEIGCVSLFLSSFDLQNFQLCFCASCA